MIGPASADASPTPGLLQLRDTVKAQSTSIGATFVDPLDEQWFTNHPEMVDPQSDIPNVAGHALMADKIAPLIAQQLQTQTSPTQAPPTP